MLWHFKDIPGSKWLPYMVLRKEVQFFKVLNVHRNMQIIKIKVEQSVDLTVEMYYVFLPDGSLYWCTQYNI